MVLASYRLKLLDSIEKDKKVHEILQRHPRKKNFIIDAIIEHEKALVDGRCTRAPKKAKEIPAHEALMDKLNAVDEKVSRLLEQGALYGPQNEDSTHDGVPEKQWKSVKKSADDGLDEADIENFQLASQAFGAFSDNDDD